MRIRSKILLGFVPFFVVALAVTIAAIHRFVGDLLLEQAEAQLASLASVQENRLRQQVHLQRERFHRTAKRPRLRALLAQHADGSGDAVVEALHSELEDALAGEPGFNAIAVADPAGNWIAASDATWFPESLHDAAWFEDGTGQFGFELDEDDVPGMFMTVHVMEGGRDLGILVIHGEMESIAALTVDYTGLGETGETLVAAREPGGDALFLAPTRFDHWAALRTRVPATLTGDPMQRALSGHEEVEWDAVDYRGRHVLAVTRHLDDPGWGLVLKKDLEEVLEPQARFDRVALTLALVLLPAVLLICWWLSARLVRPVRQLMHYARSVHAETIHEPGFGDTPKVPGGRDEVAQLEAVLRDMVNALVNERNLLEERVQERTSELESVMQRLSDSEQRLAAAVGGSQDGPWDWPDTRSPSMWFSPRCLEILGVTSDRFSPDLHGFLARVAEEDRGWLMSRLRDHAYSPGVLDYEFRTHPEGESARWLRLRGACQEGETGRYRVSGTLQDITEEKNEEARKVRLLEEREEQATRDPLTGLMNRRGFEECWQAAIAKEKPGEHAPLVLIMDADHFKRINDTWGHAVGDEVLKMLAKVINAGLRESDICARFGGEEFVLALLGIDSEIGMRIIERLRASIAEAKVEDGQGGHFQLTCSFGVALHVAGESLEGLLHRADKALYEAKEGGRNRVILAPLPQGS